MYLQMLVKVQMKLKKKRKRTKVLTGRTKKEIVKKYFHFFLLLYYFRNTHKLHYRLLFELIFINTITLISFHFLFFLLKKKSLFYK
jgi:hypothetical protein